jgi:arginine:pyruvate transaminase
LDGGSDGWEVFDRARRMAAAGEPITHLTIGDHDIGTDPRILDEMHRAAHAGHTGYASVPGIPALRDAIAARVTAQTGVETTRDNVLVTAGGQAALFASHAACANPGAAALFIDPYYATYPGTLRALQLEPRAVPSHPDLGFQPQVADIDAANSDGRARTLMVNSPNNPTGVVYTPETMRAITKACAAHDLWIISDEVYDSQIWAGQHTSAWSFAATRARTLVVNSMSKTFAMTGSRIGWIIAQPEVIGHLTNLATNTTYGVPGFIQDAALFALQQGPAFEAEIAAPFQRRRALAMRLIERSTVVRAVPSGGAMYVMLDIRATGLSGEAFANALLDDEKIAVMPGESFGQAAAGHLRIAMTVDDTRFEEALSRIIAYAEARADQAA